ncbi:hypothetical protein [Nostoc sp.]|uniref:hypothetical protein n=1 Tax=Nostoc sp. TaxID=1180 RepID=UPI002FF4B8B2
MTIQKDTNNLCKLIQSFPLKKKVQEIFYRLDKSGREVMLATIASQINRQFLGYLLANHSAKEQKQNPYLLSLQELNILEQVHNLLLHITDAICVLDNLLPNAQLSINPYSDYNYILNKDKLFNSETELKLISDTLNVLKTNFKNHPSIYIIEDCLKNLSGVESSIRPEELLNCVLNYRQAIINNSFTDITRNLELELFNQQDLKTYYTGKLIRSLIVLRDSIFNVNQFLYQALRYEKPMILNRDNVFANEGLHQNWLGEVIYLKVQPIAKEAYSHPGDVVLVSLKLGDLLKDGFYRIDKINLYESSNFGLSLTFVLREINENMVCYPQLLI